MDNYWEVTFDTSTNKRKFVTEFMSYSDLFRQVRLLSSTSTPVVRIAPGTVAQKQRVRELLTRFKHTITYHEDAKTCS